MRSTEVPRSILAYDITRRTPPTSRCTLRAKGGLLRVVAGAVSTPMANPRNPGSRARARASLRDGLVVRRPRRKGPGATAKLAPQLLHWRMPQKPKNARRMLRASIPETKQHKPTYRRIPWRSRRRNSRGRCDAPPVPPERKNPRGRHRPWSLWRHGIATPHCVAGAHGVNRWSRLGRRAPCNRRMPPPMWPAKPMAANIRWACAEKSARI